MSPIHLKHLYHKHNAYYEANKMKLDISVVNDGDPRDYDRFCINIELTRKELLQLSCQDVPWKSITDILDTVIQKKTTRGRQDD